MFEDFKKHFGKKGGGMFHTNPIKKSDLKIAKPEKVKPSKIKIAKVKLQKIKIPRY